MFSLTPADDHARQIDRCGFSAQDTFSKAYGSKAERYDLLVFAGIEAPFRSDDISDISCSIDTAVIAIVFVADIVAIAHKSLQIIDTCGIRDFRDAVAMRLAGRFFHDLFQTHEDGEVVISTVLFSDRMQVI